jgi:hypothetical protein
MDNGSNNKFPSGSVNYSLSAAKLMLPKEYLDYKQTNLNLLVEVLGQTLGGRQILFGLHQLFSLYLTAS